MGTKVYREEIVKTESGEQFEVETYGELQHLPRYVRAAFAIFGMFERTDAGTLLYTTSSDEMDVDELDSHYADDLKCLQEGRIEIVD